MPRTFFSSQPPNPWLFSIDRENSAQAPDILTAAALLYLALPSFVFLGGWLRPPYAIGAVALLAAGLCQLLRGPHQSWRLPYRPSHFLFIIAVALAWTSLGGAGHFFYANRDWQIRDTVLADLVLTDWPPAYSMDGSHFHILRSAIGYFLPAALVGKIFGMASLDTFLYFWTALGSALFLLLLPLHNVRQRLALLVFVVVFFSGMDLIGVVLVTGYWPIFPLNLEWWAPFTYTSMAGQLYWAPNHCLALWLTTAIFYRHWGHISFPGQIIVLAPLSVLWTPFAVAGMLPFWGLATYRAAQSKGWLRLSGVTAIQISAAIALTYLMVRLMTLDFASVTANAGLTATVARNNEDFFANYLLFVLLEFGALGLLIARRLQHSHGLLFVAAVLLAALPLYHLGPSNDFMLRLSTPSLVIVLILTLDVVARMAPEQGTKSHNYYGWMLGVVLAIGAYTPFSEMWRAISFRRTPPNYAKTLVEQEKGIEPAHYIGRLERTDLQILLRPPTLVLPGRERVAQGLAPLPASSK